MIFTADWHGQRTEAGTVGYINGKGEWVIEPAFEGGKNFDPETGLARVKTAVNWAYVNKSGEVILYE